MIYWIKQLLGIGFLVFLAFVLDLYMNNNLIMVKNTIIKQLSIVLVISVIIFTFNQLLYNFSTVKSDFMKHPIWKKMHVIMFVWLIISFTIFVILFIATPLPDIVQNKLWVLYLIVYYFLFFKNIMVLSIVNISGLKTMSVKRKLITTWIFSTLLVTLIIFFIPSI